MKEVSIKRQITEWIFENYNITFLPKYVYIYLGKIYHGNFKNMSKPIPAIDLLDMWRRKMDYLNRINAKNIEKGKNIIDVARVYYDLNILITKYDSYCRWKAKNKDLFPIENKSLNNSSFQNDNSSQSAGSHNQNAGSLPKNQSLIAEGYLYFYKIGTVLPESFRKKCCNKIIYYAMYKLGYTYYDPHREMYRWLPTPLAEQEELLIELPDDHRVLWTPKGIAFAYNIASNIENYVTKDEVIKVDYHDERKFTITKEKEYEMYHKTL